MSCASMPIQLEFLEKVRHCTQHFLHEFHRLCKTAYVLIGAENVANDNERIWCFF